jgi:hypothetical protein
MYNKHRPRQDVDAFEESSVIRVVQVDRALNDGRFADIDAGQLGLVVGLFEDEEALGNIAQIVTRAVISARAGTENAGKESRCQF